MKRKKNKIKWVLPWRTEAMWLRMYRNGDYMRIEAHLCSWTSGVELSLDACRKLFGFIRDYQRANVPGGPRAVRCGVLWEGVDRDVMPEHADEIAGRIAAFITDPVNHHPVPVPVPLYVGTGWNLLGPHRIWTEKQAKAVVERARQTVEAAYSDLLADPLGAFPGKLAERSV